MTEHERLAWVKNKSGAELLNRITELAAKIRQYDVIVVMGSDYRINVMEAFLNKDVIAILIGQSPIEKDVYLEPKKLEVVLQELTSKGNKEEEKHD